MSVQIIPSNLLLEAIGVKPTEKAAESAEAKEAAPVRASQPQGTAGTEKAAGAERLFGGRRPAYDQFVPEKPMDKAYYGHYQPVSDGNGNITVRFDPPTEKAADAGTRDPGKSVEGKTSQAPAGKETAKGEEAAKPQDSGKPAAPGAAGKQKIKSLKQQQKQLKQQIKASADRAVTAELRKKLAKVEQALKAAEK